ncbi:MAG TPA: hypothetical protein VES68_03465 [Candidatus Sulfotelmatobacter sp.]|nr:hypothetical protein [Candidatus Sulfotelmatobacter sp.]
MMQRPLWQRIIYNIWPSIHRTITSIVFFIVMVLKATVRLALKQVKEI